MKTTTTTLHQWEVSPFCGKVRRMLNEKEIPYQCKNYNGALVPFAAKLSKVGKLPVLDINGERITGSGAIAIYLDKQFPDTVQLIPSDPLLKAQMSIYQDWADSSLYWYNFYFRLKYDAAWEKTSDFFSAGRPAYEKLIVKLVGRMQYMRQLNGQGLGRYPKAQVETDFITLMDQLDVSLTANKWLVGDSKTIADIAVASQLHEVMRTSHLTSELTSRPALFDWLNRT